jgi:hypothetical protein
LCHYFVLVFFRSKGALLMTVLVSAIHSHIKHVLVLNWHYTDAARFWVASAAPCARFAPIPLPQHAPARKIGLCHFVTSGLQFRRFNKMAITAQKRQK